MQVGGGFYDAGFVGERGGVDDEEDGVNVRGVGELGRREVAQFAVPRGVEEEEAPGALEGRVAGGAVVGGCGDVWAGEEGRDGERGGGGVGLRGGVALCLGGLLA